MDLAAINVKKPREAQIWKCSTGNPALRILPDSNNLTTISMLHVTPYRTDTQRIKL